MKIETLHDLAIMIKGLDPTLPIRVHNPGGKVQELLLIDEVDYIIETGAVVIFTKKEIQK